MLLAADGRLSTLSGLSCDRDADVRGLRANAKSGDCEEFIDQAWEQIIGPFRRRVTAAAAGPSVPDPSDFAWIARSMNGLRASVLRPDADRGWREIDDLPKQAFAFVFGLGAEQRIAVAGERCVDFLPIFRCQMFACLRY